MFGIKVPRKVIRSDEAEKPFWISFSDLMTALMVLFLVAMTVAILRVTQATITAPQKHAEAIAACMVDVEAMTRDGFPGITVSGHSISFGTLALFPKDANEFAKSFDPASRPADATLRAYVPRVLDLTRSPKCSGVFKRIIVEGFASQSGTYLHNLDLSLKRAERVLCVLLDASAPDSLTEPDRIDVRNLFLVGGSSFNALKASAEESQRVELKLEFLGYGEQREAMRSAPLDPTLDCPLRNNPWPPSTISQRS